MKIIKMSLAVILTVVMVMSVCVFISSAAVGPFADVKSNAWYADAVEYCYTNGYVSGTTPTTFSPSSNLTRAQFVTLLANIEGVELGVYTDIDSGFDDVKTKHWFHDAVTWAAQEGYVSGVSATKFDPNGKITREQLARILYVYTDKKGYDVLARAELSAYGDAGKISSWAYEQVQWAVAVGLISGVSPTSVSPRGNATRAQAARIIMLYTQLELTEKNAFKEFRSSLSPIYINPVSGMPLTDCYSYSDEYIELIYFEKIGYLYFSCGETYGYSYQGKTESEGDRSALESRVYELCGYTFADVIAAIPYKDKEEMNELEKLVSAFKSTGQGYDTLLTSEKLFDFYDRSYEDAEGIHKEWYYDRLTLRYTPADDELLLWYSVDSHNSVENETGRIYVSESEGLTVDIEGTDKRFFATYSYTTEKGRSVYYNLQFTVEEDGDISYTVYNCEGITEEEAMLRADAFIPGALDKVDRCIIELCAI